MHNEKKDKSANKADKEKSDKNGNCQCHHESKGREEFEMRNYPTISVYYCQETQQEKDRGEGLTFEEVT